MRATHDNRTTAVGRYQEAVVCLLRLRWDGHGDAWATCGTVDAVVRVELVGVYMDQANMDLREVASHGPASWSRAGWHPARIQGAQD